jgi:hypothetical protein
VLLMAAMAWQILATTIANLCNGACHRQQWCVYMADFRPLPYSAISHWQHWFWSSLINMNYNLGTISLTFWCWSLVQIRHFGIITNNGRMQWLFYTAWWSCQNSAP